MPKEARTRAVSAAQVRTYVAKAEEYAAAAGQDHDQVLVLLRQAGKDGTAVEKELRRLLPLKTKAEYEPDDVPRSTAAKAVERADRCVTVARRAAPR